MSMMLNTVIQSTAASSGAAAGTAAAAPAANAGVPQAQAADAQGAAPAQAPAQLFAAWLGDQGQAAALAVQAGLATESTGADAAAPAPATAPATPDGADDDGASAASLPQDGALLAAMAMPLMPLNPAQVAQAVQAAQPTRAQADAPSGDTGKALAVAAAADPASTGLEAGRRSASLPQAPEAQAAAARPSETAPAMPLAAHAGADTDTGSGANPGANAGGPNTGTNGGSTADKGAERTANAAPAASADRGAIAAAMPSQPAASAPAPDTVKLAGPPTAWRQSLQEALGDRMNVQVGKGIEQAVIRLEPPQLGRIDIAIRHSAGTLEVNISATNGEVLRQLQTVSDNLRSDLSQRQFTEVAVTVTPAPKNGAAPFGDPQQGRGRQQGREQEDQQPGRALAEADNNSSAFSLGGRGQA
jgi:flagellar hook-length control protein FliK